MRTQVEFFTIGTGAVHHIPSWGCDCPVCTQVHNGERTARTPASAMIKIMCGDTIKHILIDAGQMDIAERYDRNSVSAIVLTHYHGDHVQGLLPLRWHGNAPLSVFSVYDNTSPFAYELHTDKGILDFTFVDAFTPFVIEGICFTPVPLNHTMPTLGYVMSYKGTTVAYLCDTHGLPTETENYLKSIHIDTLLLDCTHAPNKTSVGHCNLDQAYDIYTSITPDTMYLTHIEHDFDVWMLDNSIPAPLKIAYDNTKICTF